MSANAPPIAGIPALGALLAGGAVTPTATFPNGELLGAELLVFEVLSEFNGPNYSDADLASAGASALDVRGSRALLATVNAPGVGAALLTGQTVVLAGLSSAGVGAVFAQGGARVQAGLSSAGVAALTLPSVLVRAGAYSMAGSASVAFQPQSTPQIIREAVLSSLGSSTVALFGQRLSDGRWDMQGAAVTLLPAIGWSTLPLGVDLIRPAEVRVMVGPVRPAEMKPTPETPSSVPSEMREMTA